EPLEPTPLGITAITIAGALMLFSLTGFEAAAVTANVTRNSTTTVPVATMVGTGFTTVIYLLATVSALMLLPSAIAAKSGAPFADAIAPILGSVAARRVVVTAAVTALRTASTLLR